jgi:hypothetical protein
LPPRDAETQYQPLLDLPVCSEEELLATVASFLERVIPGYATPPLLFPPGFIIAIREQERFPAGLRPRRGTFNVEVPQLFCTTHAS